MGSGIKRHVCRIGQALKLCTLEMKWREDYLTSLSRSPVEVSFSGWYLTLLTRNDEPT